MHNKNIVSIRQPIFYPWLPYFQQLAQSDLNIIFDSAELSKQQKEAKRNIILGKNGIITIKIPTINKFNQKYKDVKIDNSSNWKKKNIKSIKRCYSKSKFFNTYFPFLEDTYSKNWENLVDFNIHITQWLSKEFEIDTKFIKSSDLIDKDKKNQRLINLCKQVNATEYLSGIGGKNYLVPELFEKENITVTFREESEIIYKQINSNKFVKNLSAIDLLFNEGKNSKNYFKK